VPIHLHFTRFPSACITTTGLRDGASRRSSKEISEAMFSWDGPWESVADGAGHVARKIFESIRLKRQKFHSPGFGAIGGGVPALNPQIIN